MSDTNDPVIYELTKARIKLFMGMPFFGVLAGQLVLEDATKWCKSVASDGVHFYYNRDFIKKLTRSELLFIFGHEVCHAVFDHIGRRNGRDKQVYGMACDYLVNYTLVKEGVGTMPPEGLYDKRFTDDMTSDEIYDILMRESVSIKMTLDEHLDAVGENESGNGGDNETVVRVIGGQDGPPKLTKEDIERIKNKTRAAMVSAAHAAGAGRVPASIARMIDGLIAPKMSWKELLDTHIRSSVKDDYTFQRSSRRQYDGGFILPGQNYEDTIDVCIAIDTSGSMTQEMLRDFLSEVRGIMQTFRDYKVSIYTFDTKVYNFRVYTPDNGDDISEYPMEGGGGTSFVCCFDWMKEHNIEPDRFIMFTDSYSSDGWGDPNYCDTLFVIHGDPFGKIIAPFGMTAHYN